MELYAYIKMRIKEEFGTNDIDEAAMKFLTILKQRRDIGKYDKKVWGDYPKVLKEYTLRKFNIEL